jgi:hypothetical protein
LNQRQKLNPTNNNLPYSNNLNRTMKNSILRGLFAAALLLVSSSAFAQDGSTDDAQTTANANVLVAVEVEAPESLEFGNVTPNNIKAISTAGTVVAGIAGTNGLDERAALFTVTKGTFSEVLLEFDLPSVLNGSGSAANQTLEIYFNGDAPQGAGKYALLQTDDVSAQWDPTTSVGTTEPNAILLSAVDYQDFFEKGAFTLKLGGRVEPDPAQVAGSYSGTITLTATYN